MDEILYITIVDRDIVIITEDEAVKGSLTKQLDYILSHFGFARLNQSKIVNLNKIKSYDPNLGVVYFDEEKTVFCLVSRRNRHKVSTLFDKNQHE